MTCYLLHMVEMPERDPYADEDLKDLVGQMPQLYCAQCTPPRHLKASESARCLSREGPCWKPSSDICAPEN